MLHARDDAKMIQSLGTWGPGSLAPTWQRVKISAADWALGIGRLASLRQQQLVE